MGADEYRKMGTEGSPGTKTFAITGQVANTGLIEVPFGTTLREIIFGIAGGVTGDDGSIDEKNFKAVQIGGPSGACLTPEHLDLPLDFDSLKTVGGNGRFRRTCSNEPVDLQWSRLPDTLCSLHRTSPAGNVFYGREGTKQMLALMDDITTGKAE